MSVHDTVETIRVEQRRPTRAEAAAAAAVLLHCNGADLSDWTDGAWPDDEAVNALKDLVWRYESDLDSK